MGEQPGVGDVKAAWLLEVATIVHRRAAGMHGKDAVRVAVSIWERHSQFPPAAAVEHYIDELRHSSNRTRRHADDQ